MDGQSTFASALEGLLDTAMFTRDEWARFLDIPQTSITEWLADAAVPRPDLLRVICDLAGNSRVAQKPLIDFQRIAHLPATDISPLGSHMSPTVKEYMQLSVREFGYRLYSLSPQEQIKALGDGSFGYRAPQQ